MQCPLSCSLLSPGRTLESSMGSHDRSIRTDAPIGGGFPGGKESGGLDSSGDIRNMGSIPGSGRSPGKGNGNPLQYSCLGNPMARGAWRATVSRVTKSQTWVKWLSMHARASCGNWSWYWPFMVAQMAENLPALQIQETHVRSLGWEDPLKEEMATHSSILAWRIPWTEKPGGLQSMRSQRVGHDWSVNSPDIAACSDRAGHRGLSFQLSSVSSYPSLSVICLLSV